MSITRNAGPYTRYLEFQLLVQERMQFTAFISYTVNPSTNYKNYWLK